MFVMLQPREWHIDLHVTDVEAGGHVPRKGIISKHSHSVMDRMAMTRGFTLREHYRFPVGGLRYRSRRWYVRHPLNQQITLCVQFLHIESPPKLQPPRGHRYYGCFHLRALTRAPRLSLEYLGEGPKIPPPSSLVRDY